MFDNWCWAHWIALVYIIVSIPASSFNQYQESGSFTRALATLTLASVIAIIEIYVLHVGGFW